jgi:uncharacterized protein YcbK (DUF882 family)
MNEPDWDSYANFARHEFECSPERCGCGQAAMHPAFMDRLQRLRRAFRQPIIITSGYRCPDYNACISTTGRHGPHTTGRAADVQVVGGDALDLLVMAREQGFTGIGVKQHGKHGGRFIHLDDLPDHYAGPRPWLWSYG